MILNFVMSVYFSNSLTNGEYSDLLIAVAFSVETSSPVKNSYLQTIPDHKAEILALFISKLHWALFYPILLLFVLTFLLTVIL